MVVNARENSNQPIKRIKGHLLASVASPEEEFRLDIFPCQNVVNTSSAVIANKFKKFQSLSIEGTEELGIKT